MNLKFFILGLYVLVLIAQVKTLPNGIDNAEPIDKPNQFNLMELFKSGKRSILSDLLHLKGAESEEIDNASQKEQAAGDVENPKSYRRFDPLGVIGGIVQKPMNMMVKQALAKIFASYSDPNKPFGPTYDTTWGSPPSGRRMDASQEEGPMPVMYHTPGSGARTPSMSPSSGARLPGMTPSSGARLPSMPPSSGARLPSMPPSSGARLPGMHPSSGARLPGMYQAPHGGAQMPGMYQAPLDGVRRMPGMVHPYQDSTRASNLFKPNFPETNGMVPPDEVRMSTLIQPPQNNLQMPYSNPSAQNYLSYQTYGSQNMPSLLTKPGIGMGQSHYSYGQTLHPRHYQPKYGESSNEARNVMAFKGANTRNGYMGNWGSTENNREMYSDTQVEFNGGQEDVAIGNRRFAGNSQEGNLDELLISTAQHLQDGSPDDDGEDDGQGQEGGGPENQTEDEIEQRRKITSIMNSAVNVIEPQDVQRQEIYSNSNMGFMAPPHAPMGPPAAIGPPVGGLLGTLFGLGSSLLPMLKPLLDIIKNTLPVVTSLLGPIFNAIMKAIPLLPKLLDFVKPLLGFLANITKYLPQLLECLKTIAHILLKGLKFLLNGLKTLYNLLPVLPQILNLIPSVIHALWRVWHSIRYVLLYPIRSFRRWLHRIVHFLYSVPGYLEDILHAIGFYLGSPLRILGYLIKCGFHAFNDFVIKPVARLKYFLINLFDVLLGPVVITRQFLEALVCLFVKTPIKVFRSVMRAFFVDGILNTIRYVKTVIYEIIIFPWSHHYADMFPSLGNRHNYIFPSQIICQGNAC